MMSEISPQDLEGIRCSAEIIRGSKHAVALTGAGISTRSGIPDFRSTNSGLWSRYDPFEVASLTAFRYRPEKFYEWLRPLATGIHRALPNPAHFALADLERGGFLKAVITQNIDGLHQRAGSQAVHEVHGTMATLSCTRCFRQTGSEDYIQPYLDQGILPRCKVCGGVLKPDVVLFGEQLPARTWLKAQEISKQCDLMIVAGSSLEVLPVAGLPMRALENGAHLIIINQSETYINVRADVVFHDDVADILPRIISEVIVD